MKSTKLIHFNDTKKDLLFWIKHFLADKIATVSTAKTKDDFDVASLVHNILSDSTDTIEKVVEITRKAQSQGLAGLKRPASNIVKFYRFIEKNADSFPALTSISVVTVDHFAYKDDNSVSEASREAMFDVARNFFNFIDDNTLKGEHLFGISRGTRGRGKGNSSFSKKTRKRLISYLSEDEMRRYNKAILKIEYRDEVERNRDILIGRILLFAGITTNELIALRDEDLVQDEIDNNTLWINIQGKGAAKREIPMPKRKLIVFLNSYKEGRGLSKNGRLFHSPVDIKKEITENVIRSILKRQFKEAGLAEAKATPTVIRNSFGIFMFRKMFLEGNPNADRYVQKVMGHANVQTTRNLVKADGIRMMRVADVFNDFFDK
jgi:integrase